MGKGSRKRRSHITDLPDEHLYLIFEKLESNLDKQSFGLSCHHFLNIQDSSCKVLDINEFHLSKNILHGRKLNSFTLHRLLNRFRELESLSLTWCANVTDSGLLLLQTYGFKLRSLRLDYCMTITNVGFSFIASGCPSLSVINLYATNIGDSGLEILTKSCNSLREVNLGYCDNITDSGIEYLMRNCRQLRLLSISHSKNIYGKGFKGCSSTLASLEAMGCDFAAGLTEILSGGGLEYLNLSGHPKIVRGHGLAAIGSGVAANLKALNFWGCRFVKDDAIISISKGCPLLQDWNLNSCENVTISGWESIGLYCQSLERIHVSSCSKFCDRALLALGNGCRKLSVIYMRECPQITPSAIQHFETHIGTELQPVVRSIIPTWGFETLPLFRL